MQDPSHYRLISYFNSLTKYTSCRIFVVGKKGEIRGGPRAAATCKMERFQSLTIITKRSILDVAAALDPPLEMAKTIKNDAPRIFLRTLSCSDMEIESAKTY